MDEFFKIKETKTLIQRKIVSISEVISGGDFKASRSYYCTVILKSMFSNADDWDKYTSFNIREMSGNLNELLEFGGTDDNSLNILFSTLFRFLMEYSFKIDFELGPPLSEVKFFAIKERGEFNGTALTRIDFSINILPFYLMREKYQSDDVKHFIKAAESEGSMKELMTSWNKKIETQTKKVEALSTILERQEIAYNFVGLSKAFNNLLIIKRVESRNALAYVIILATLALLPLASEFFYFLSIKDDVKIDQSKLALLIPAVSITAIMVYYFKVSLSNFQSIKSQVVQIELRKSLCTFIQNYSEYAEDMKDKESLRKFENVIFSNIMPSEDKIPSTFDGVEQIAKLIESVKK
ncbi:hypothetical protein [Pectobacterium carotovorum]|uniref:hypothetical protein n=1 Tax=Pectobacterium carotovorum TaxID=554 RepID=UPI002B24FAE7|nr:hypothetical protein [Pectobacterium carotovorum]